MLHGGRYGFSEHFNPDLPLPERREINLKVGILILLVVVGVIIAIPVGWIYSGGHLRWAKSNPEKDRLLGRWLKILIVPICALLVVLAAFFIPRT